MEYLEKALSHLDRPVWGNPLWAWSAALGTAALIVLTALLLRRVLVRRARARAEKTGQPLHRGLAEILSRISVLLILFAGLYAGAQILSLSPKLDGLLRSALVLLVLVQAGLWASALVGFWLGQKLQGPQDAARSTGVLMLSFGGKLVVWTLVLLLSLENLGVDITALIAGLGVGGIAVALAVQNVLGDLLGSVAIALDKPFEIGDFIIVGDLMGTVERIGLKTTRVRSLSGEQLVFSNSDLLGSRVRNFKRMKERRVVFSIGVTYQTPVEKVEAIPQILREAIEAREDVRFDRAHFKAYGDFALLFEAVYYVLKPDYNVYMDRQQAINLDIHRRFTRESIEFAYPTQTLFVQTART